MNNFVLSLLMAMPQTAGGEASGSGSLLTSLLPFVLIIAIFYFLIIRPQSKKRKETERMLSALKKGDKVVTIGGLHGTIQNVRESTVIIKVDDNVKMEFSRSAVSSIVSLGKEEKEDKQDKEESKGRSEESSDTE